MKNLIYLTLATFSFVFASCSMSKNNANSCYLSKLETKQQLTVPGHISEKMATIDVPIGLEVAPINQDQISRNEVKLLNNDSKRPGKTLLNSTLVTKARQGISKMTQIPNAIASISQITRMPKHIASAKRGQLSDTAYLLLWIITLIASAIFFFLINVFGELTFLGVLFNILAILALVAFIVFFILWITQIYKRKHHII